MFKNFRLLPIVIISLLVLILSGPVASVYAAAISPVSLSDVGAYSLAQSMMADSSTLISARFISAPPSGTPHGISDALSFFPSNGGSFAIMTSGDVNLADDPNTSESSGVDLGGDIIPARGNTAYDVTVLEINFDPPSQTNCLRLDFAFYSEEYYEYVGWSFNDSFIAELDQTTWYTNYSDIYADNNFAFDDMGQVISINSTGETSMSTLNSSGTTYDGATVLLQAAAAYTPNTSHTLYLSIFDQGDNVWDSAVFIDNVRMETVSSPETECVPGAEIKKRTPVILIPGVTGTKMVNDYEELWPNTNELITNILGDKFLLKLRLDYQGTGPLFPNNLEYSTVRPTEVIDVVIFDPLGIPIETVEVYKPTIDTLVAAGYELEKDLFLFPYDWRMDIDSLASTYETDLTDRHDNLLAFIDDIREKTGVTKVDIIAHSMGGLITRSLLTNENSIGKVRKVVTLGTPVLGAPKLLGELEYQNPCHLEKEIFGVLACFSDRSTLQETITNFPSVYQMLPSPSYDVVHRPPLMISEDPDGDGVYDGVLYDYNMWTKIVGENRNGYLLSSNWDFHVSYDYLDMADPTVQLFRIVGDKINTVEQIRVYNQCYPEPWDFLCQTEYGITYSNGDETVPFHSADLYNPDIGFDFRAGMPNAYAHGVPHGELQNNSDVLDFILSFFGTMPLSSDDMSSATTTNPEGILNRRQSELLAKELGLIFEPQIDLSIFGLSETPEPFSGIELEIIGPFQGIIQDSQGNSISFSNENGLEATSEIIPGSTYNAIGNTQSIFFNNEEDYQSWLKINDLNPTIMRFRTYSNSEIDGQAVFNIAEPQEAEFQISFTSAMDLTSLQLQIDSNADGIIDEVVSPDSSYIGPGASDFVAPFTTADIVWTSPVDVDVTLSAEDQPSGTGVSKTYYRILGSADPTPQEYTGPFNIPVGTELEFFSVDNVGNTEAIQSIQIIDTISPTGEFLYPLLGGNLLKPKGLLSVSALDNFSGVKSVTFYAFYNGESHMVGIDTDGSDGWQIVMPTYAISDKTIKVNAVVEDFAGNVFPMELSNITVSETITFGNGYETRGGAEESQAPVSIPPSSMIFQVPDQQPRIWAPMKLFGRIKPR